MTRSMTDETTATRHERLMAALMAADAADPEPIWDAIDAAVPDATDAEVEAALVEAGRRREHAPREWPDLPL
jgi:hypothetical protein